MEIGVGLDHDHLPARNHDVADLRLRDFEHALNHPAGIAINQFIAFCLAKRGEQVFPVARGATEAAAKPAQPVV